MHLYAEKDTRMATQENFTYSLAFLYALMYKFQLAKRNPTFTSIGASRHKIYTDLKMDKEVAAHLLDSPAAFALLDDGLPFLTKRPLLLDAFLASARDGQYADFQLGFITQHDFNTGKLNEKLLQQYNEEAELFRNTERAIIEFHEDAAYQQFLGDRLATQHYHTIFYRCVETFLRLEAAQSIAANTDQHGGPKLLMEIVRQGVPLSLRPSILELHRTANTMLGGTLEHLQD